jgi:hypothetical protein
VEVRVAKNKSGDSVDKADRSGLSGDVKDVVDMLKAYARQETLGPFKDVGRFVGFGIAGSVFLAVGVLLLGLAGLRALQTQFGTWFTGNWSWSPYLIMLIPCALVIFMSTRAIMKAAGGDS